MRTPTSLQGWRYVFDIWLYMLTIYLWMDKIISVFNPKGSRPLSPDDQHHEISSITEELVKKSILSETWHDGLHGNSWERLLFRFRYDGSYDESIAWWANYQIEPRHEWWVVDKHMLRYLHETINHELRHRARNVMDTPMMMNCKYCSWEEHIL